MCRIYTEKSRSAPSRFDRHRKVGKANSPILHMTSQVLQSNRRALCGPDPKGREG